MRFFCTCVTKLVKQITEDKWDVHPVCFIIKTKIGHQLLYGKKNAVHLGGTKDNEVGSGQGARTGHTRGERYINAVNGMSKRGQKYGASTREKGQLSQN